MPAKNSHPPAARPVSASKEPSSQSLLVSAFRQMGTLPSKGDVTLLAVQVSCSDLLVA